MLPHFPAGITADESRAILDASGWSEIASGDWAWVFASPDDSVVARVTPFDPAFRLFAERSLDGRPNPYLVRVDRLIPLRRKGYVVIMERLHPAPDDRAHRLIASVAIEAGRTSAQPDSGAEPADDPDVADLRDRLADLLVDGARRFHLWGGADIKPENILQTDDGHLRITDPVYLRGLDIVEAIGRGDAETLRDFSRDDLLDFLTIPVFSPGPETDALMRKVDALEFRSAASRRSPRDT